MTTTWTAVEERIVWTATEDPSYQFVTLRPTTVTLSSSGTASSSSEVVSTSTTLEGPPHTVGVSASGVTLTLPTAEASDSGLVWFLRNLNIDATVEVAGLAEGDGTETIPVSQGLVVVGFESATDTYVWMRVGFLSADGSGGGGGVSLGETSSTAYRGDRGKTAYDHSQVVTGNPHGTSKSDVGLGNVDNTSDANKPVSTAQQTALDAKAPATRTVGTGLGTSGTVNLDMASLHGTIQTIAASGSLTFTTSNRAAGREVTLVITAGGSSRTLSWPSWLAVGAALPTTLASGKTMVVTVTFTDTTDAAAVAAAATQP